MSSLGPTNLRPSSATHSQATTSSGSEVLTYIESQGQEAPAHLSCPISQELMRDPVVTASGRTYERSSIKRWLTTNDTDPLTRAPIGGKALIPNFAVRSLVDSFIEEVGREASRRGLDPTQLTGEAVAQRRAAVTVQRHVRGYLVRRPALAAQRERQAAAATVIQKHTRGHAARARYQEAKDAVSTIQRQVRGHQARQALRRDALEQMQQGKNKMAATLVRIGALSPDSRSAMPKATPKATPKASLARVGDLAGPTLARLHGSSLGQPCPLPDSMLAVWYTAPLTLRGVTELGLLYDGIEAPRNLSTSRFGNVRLPILRMVASEHMAVLANSNGEQTLIARPAGSDGLLELDSSSAESLVRTHTNRSATRRSGSTMAVTTPFGHRVNFFANPDSVVVFDGDPDLSLSLESSASASGMQRHALRDQRGPSTLGRFLAEAPSQAWHLRSGEVAAAFGSGSVQVFSADLQREVRRFSIPAGLGKFDIVPLDKGLVAHTADQAAAYSGRTGKILSRINLTEALPEGRLLAEAHPQWTVAGPHLCGISSTGLLWTWNIKRNNFLRGGFGARYLAAQDASNLLVTYNDSLVVQHTLVDG